MNMNPPLLKPLLFALALAPQALANFTPADSAKAVSACQGGSFLSTTVFGKTPDNARAKAKAEIARNIVSDIKSSVKTSEYSEEKGGVLKEGSKYAEASEIESSLTLLGFKEVETPKRQKNGEYELKAYACVKDVAKPYLEKQRLADDSLEIAANTALSARHPRNKNEAWQRTRSLWVEFIKLQKLLEVLGIESPFPAMEIYERAKADYGNYCQDMKLHWESSNSQCSKAVFAELSKEVNIEESGCSKGLNLKFSCSEECKSTSMGIKCFYEPSLAIESCGGESYSRLSAKELPAGSDKNSESSAKEKLARNLPQASFLKEWETEIKKWEPQCVK